MRKGKGGIVRADAVPLSKRDKFQEGDEKMGKRKGAGEKTERESVRKVGICPCVVWMKPPFAKIRSCPSFSI